MVRVYCGNERCKYYLDQTDMCKNDIYFNEEIFLDENGECELFKAKDESDEVAD